MTAIVKVKNSGISVGASRRGVVRCLLNIDLAGNRRIQIVDVDRAVLASSIDVSTVCAPRRTEVTSDQGLQDRVSSECHDLAVMGMLVIPCRVVGLVSVIER